MKQKVWILLAVLLLLVAFTFVRERFEATASIKAPPYDDDAKRRIFEAARTQSQETLKTKAKSSVTVPETDPGYRAKLEAAAGGLLAPAVGDFFTTVFKPATTPITAADVTKFMSTRPASDLKEIEQEVLTTYFVGQQGIGTSQATGYADMLRELGQNPGYLVTGAEGTSGVAGTANPFEGATMMPGGAPAGAVLNGEPTAGGGVTMLNGEPTTGGVVTVLNGGLTPPATTTGTTTGGSSTTSLGPTSGTTGASGQRIFGPIFTGRGEGGNPGNGGDSTKTNQYPELLGGRGGAPPSTKMDGGGIVPPSKNWTLTNDGSLPPSCSLGVDSMSAYYPFSRCPGDMDLIPDPYRLSRNFSTASYSSKTEPAPFLTDFSAFLK